MYVAGELTKANTWHLALFDVVSGHVGPRLPEEGRRDARRDIVGHSCRCRDGRADLQTMHMAVNTLDDSATPRHATCCNCSPLPCPALPPVALPFLRLSLKFTALRHFISGAGGAAARGGAASLWAQTFPKCDKTTNRQKKKRGRG